jgi:tripartite-type tricarboxylate transporter receptor subunit TctC
MRIVARALVLAAAALSCAAPAHAQSYPSRSIEMIVPFPAGSITDTMARAMQSELSRALGQTVSIANKDGGLGTLGIIDLARAAPDGYTIAFTSNNPLSAQPHVQKVPYGAASFRHICLAYHSPLVLVGGLQAPFKTAEELVALARTKPQSFVYGFPGVASQQHLGMLAVLKAIDANGRGVSFTSGAAALRALFDGGVVAMVETPAVAPATDFPVLAALSEERMQALPDVRTLKELGYPATAFIAGGLVAPANIPAAAAEALDKACAAATASPEYKTMARRLNIEARYLSGEDFRKLIEKDRAENGEIIARAGLSRAK